jgi:molybdopterin-containing oxidoreductase family iron-sulfur binding subunit
MSQMSERRLKDEVSRMTRTRAKLNGSEGSGYWRSLEELQDTEEFRNFLEREFPESASTWLDPVGRRNFLQLMGASMALAGIGACTKQPNETIVPYIKQPEELIPGKPLFYATAVPQSGYGQGVLVESHMGRPTKVEGNPDHPSSLGTTNIFSQASVLDLYDPDRLDVVTKAASISTWEEFLAEFNLALETLAGRDGDGLRILTETVTSPTLGDQIDRLLEKLPEAKWHQWDPVGEDSSKEGARIAFGRYLKPQYDLRNAEVIVSLGSDFLYWGPGASRYAREFADKRRLSSGNKTMNRLYVAETTPTVTGGMADHRIAVKASVLGSIASSLAAKLNHTSSTAFPEHDKWIQAVTSDLLRHRGSSLVIAGDEQPPEVHALAHVINDYLGNTGKTVSYTEPVEVSAENHLRSLGDLTSDIQNNRVEVLLILGGNPVYNAPADLSFGDAMANVRLRVHLTQHVNETSELCHWNIPEAHAMESWGDIRSFDGTISIIQPLIAPLKGGKTAHQLLAVLLGEIGTSDYQAVRAYWQQQKGGPGFEDFWRKSVHDGLIADSSARAVPAAVTVDSSSIDAPGPGPGLEIVFRPDPCIGDGSHANNGWLQELPKPLFKTTWDNVAMLSPGTAGELGLSNGDVVRLGSQGRSVDAPAWIQPGQANGVITVHLGYGRTRAGQVGNQVGFSAYQIRTSSGLWFNADLTLEKTGEYHLPATTQNHHLIDLQTETEQANLRHLIREGTLAEYNENPDFVHEMAHEFPEEYTLLPPHEYKGHAWGMSVDLNSCIGCNACVVACQSENNIPVVGREEVLNGREMQWIRVDRYYRGDLEDPEWANQPVMCQHCENAPCEVVCPVAATSHSDEGLNEMTYNRCVGTRYCSNNCPYKVRRFNFHLYQDWDSPTLQMMRNPDVSVRSRGVMEKCTYCVQRINSAKIASRNEDRPIRDGEIQTACETACPTRAITFGDINDTGSRVSELKKDKRSYGILTDLNTRPRTTYLARIRNKNSEAVDE